MPADDSADQQPLRDPIVEEVHRIREQMWEDCGGSLDGLIEFLRASEREHPGRLISKEELDRRRAAKASVSDTTPPAG